MNLNGPSRLFTLSISLLLGACAAAQRPLPPTRAGFLPPSTAVTPLPAALTPPATPTAHAVLSTGKRAFVLTGAAPKGMVSGPSELLPGGFKLEISSNASAALPRFTLVGPEGRCSARATRAVFVSVDYGGYAGASLPGPKHSGYELEGCATLLHENAFLIALSGDDERAEWVHPSHVDQVQVPADRRLGESEVWLNRWALPTADLEIVEKSVLSFVTPSCSEERRDVLVVDELDRPVAQHTGYYLRGAIRSAQGTLLVLMGHDEPEALRIVELGAADTRVALDTRLELFQDVERAEC